MHTQSRFERLDDSNFWKITNSLLNKNAYQTAIGSDLDYEKITEKLDKLDDTFKSPCPDIKERMNDYKKITPEYQFSLYEENKNVEEMISEIPNLKNFIKKNNKIIMKTMKSIKIRFPGTHISTLSPPQA